MKKRFWILMTVSALALAGGAASVAAAASYGEPPAAREEAETPAGYVLTDCEGRVGVFRDGELILRTGLRVETLRETDRELVAEGIRSDSYEEMIRLLEDLGA